jgi:hypothetical protein
MEHTNQQHQGDLDDWHLRQLLQHAKRRGFNHYLDDNLIRLYLKDSQGVITIARAFPRTREGARAALTWTNLNRTDIPTETLHKPTEAAINTQLHQQTIPKQPRRKQTNLSGGKLIALVVISFIGIIFVLGAIGSSNSDIVKPTSASNGSGQQTQVRPTTNSTTTQPASGTSGPTPAYSYSNNNSTGSTGPVNCTSTSIGYSTSGSCYTDQGTVNCSGSNIGTIGSTNCYGSDGSYTNCSSNNYGSFSSTNCYGPNGSTNCSSSNIGSFGSTNCYGPNGSTNCSSDTVGTETYTNCN